jgi:hypothetical protein
MIGPVEDVVARLRPHRLSVVIGWGKTAHCGCGWQGTTMEPSARAHQAAIDQYAGHLRSVQEARRQGIRREAPQ